MDIKNITILNANAKFSPTDNISYDFSVKPLKLHDSRLIAIYTCFNWIKERIFVKDTVCYYLRVI